MVCVVVVVVVVVVSNNKRDVLVSICVCCCEFEHARRAGSPLGQVKPVDHQDDEERQQHQEREREAGGRGNERPHCVRKSVVALVVSVGGRDGRECVGKCERLQD